MILVITGTHPQQFDRLLEEIDRLVEGRHIKEPVIMQTGYSNYRPRNCKWFDFTTRENMNRLLKKASIIVTHGGIGSTLPSVRLKKRTIVVPRMKQFGEHTNDHQLEIAKELSAKKMVIPVYDIKQLHEAIVSAKSFKPVNVTKSYIIQDKINGFLEQLV